MRGITTILFDWDGTLVDTSQAAFAATQNALQNFGISLKKEVYDRIYAPNWHFIYEALQLPRQSWEQADALWLQCYGRQKPAMEDGGMRTLCELADRYCLGIVTSATRTRVLNEIADLGLSALFKTVVTGDDVQNRKPHPEGLESAMKQIRRDPQVCCYVGDSPDDIEMGRRAGVLTIGISSRYPGSCNIQSAKPDFFIHSLDQLLSLFF
jgi:HAD superfamily hydrolase (TIGR01509 family)